MVMKNNKRTCECANRRVPCDKKYDFDRKDKCEDQSLSYLKTSGGKNQDLLFRILLSFIFS